jgi:hypothetical protein
LISPNEAKKSCLIAQTERRKEDAVKMENYIDNSLKTQFLGKPIVLSRSSFYHNNIPYNDLAPEILEKYRRAGWYVEISESHNEQGLDLHLTFSENTASKERK